MRDILEGIVKTCQKYGDKNISYTCGLDVFGEKDIQFLPDGGGGQNVMAENFIKHIFGQLNSKLNCIPE